MLKLESSGKQEEEEEEEEEEKEVRSIVYDTRISTPEYTRFVLLKFNEIDIQSSISNAFAINWV